MNVSLTPRLEDFARSLVASGRYGSASEVVRSALRLLEEREADIDAERALVLEGLESGAPVTVTRDEMTARMRARMSELRADGAL